MRNKEPFRDMPEVLKRWLKNAQNRGASLFRKKGSFSERVPRRVREFDFDFKKIELTSVSEWTPWIRLGLVVLGIFLLAEIASHVAGLFIRPTYTNLPKRGGGFAGGPQGPAEDYDSILRRNMFNVEGKIPDPFDQGRLDCFTQAKPSTQRMVLLGTIVMSDERFSVALVQEDSNPAKIGVKKDDLFFDGKYQAMKVDRKKFCFQVKSTQDFEYIEIPDETAGLGVTSGPQTTYGGISTEGIQATSETEFAIKKDFLEKQLGNLNEILQTARAVPYIEPGSGKFKGFLVQSVEPNSPFAALGIRQGDVLTQVNDIVLDNAGKGLEAFQRLRNSPSVDLRVIRGGRETAMSYKLK